MSKKVGCLVALAAVVAVVVLGALASNITDWLEERTLAKAAANRAAIGLDRLAKLPPDASAMRVALACREIVGTGVELPPQTAIRCSTALLQASRVELEAGHNERARELFESAGAAGAASPAIDELRRDLVFAENEVLAADAKRRRAQERRGEAQLQANMQLLTSSGLLKKLDTSLNEAYVEPWRWAALDIDTKKGVALTLANHMQAAGSSARVTILDYRSGRKLASYSAAWGWGAE